MVDVETGKVLSDPETLRPREYVDPADYTQEFDLGPDPRDGRRGRQLVIKADVHAGAPTVHALRVLIVVAEKAHFLGYANQKVPNTPAEIATGLGVRPSSPHYSYLAKKDYRSRFNEESVVKVARRLGLAKTSPSDIRSSLEPACEILQRPNGSDRKMFLRSFAFDGARSAMKLVVETNREVGADRESALAALRGREVIEELTRRFTTSARKASPRASPSHGLRYRSPAGVVWLEWLVIREAGPAEGDGPMRPRRRRGI